MRDVERQARALKLALEAATDIQANPSWEYAHIVTRIQESILDMDGLDKAVAMPVISLPQYKPVSVLGKDYDLRLSGGNAPMASIIVPGGVQHGYSITGEFGVMQTLREFLIEGLSLERFEVHTCPEGIFVTQTVQSLPHVPVDQTAILKFKKHSYAESIALSFFTHAFRNSPNPVQGTAQ